MSVVDSFLWCRGKNPEMDLVDLSLIKEVEARDHMMLFTEGGVARLWCAHCPGRAQNAHMYRPDENDYNAIMWLKTKLKYQIWILDSSYAHQPLSRGSSTRASYQMSYGIMFSSSHTDRTDQNK
eukprot:5166432-Amphidinium_carterae.1